MQAAPPASIPSASRLASASSASSGSSVSRAPRPPSPRVLRPQTKWENLFFYQKTDVLYQLTVAFCRRFLPKFGDRTVDQMVQAARSGKQNIVEGCADGVTSTETELRLLNVARGSLRELREDYADYLKARALPVWESGHPRFDAMLSFCRAHNRLPDYEPLFDRVGDEELANLALTLCHMVDRMMTTHLKKKEADFVENGGIKERMTAARLGRRRTQNAEIAALRAEATALQAENTALQAELAALRERLGLPQAGRSSPPSASSGPSAPSGPSASSGSSGSSASSCPSSSSPLDFLP